jgi:uncharacterized protein (DUF1697 family)
MRGVALVRGINVGKAKRVAMADLRRLMEGLGYRDVRTLLNSGNVVFTARGENSERLAARIEEAMFAKLGVAARVTVIAAADFETIVSRNPLVKVASDPARLLVGFLQTPADVARLKPLMREDWGPEAFALGTQAAYLWCPAGVLESRLPTAIGRILRDGTTTRNWATVTKIHALL